jgi:hypothetical protein
VFRDAERKRKPRRSKVREVRRVLGRLADRTSAATMRTSRENLLIKFLTDA